ncbi:uncharacterized protein LOC133173847 [Saccostrea echinata]|uniref:uncharacterized protein LOC133173847 n=1 Tax=Saccostrea echinata TaxID=191078 RepID=UPI002A82C788|nr:uncharacterized protein LOC133173847 [Saccostrea echinata]
MQVMPEKPSTPSDGSLNTHAYFTNNNITTSNLRRELTTPSSMVISSATTLQVPIIISKADSPFSNNVVVIGILCIGGFLCLLLTILVIQCCVRLYIQKRKLRKRVSVMLPDKDEEVYDEIKETGTFGSIRRYDGISEERQKSGKYFPLKESPKKKCQPYQHLVEPTRYQEIEDIKSVSVKSSISESSAENSNGLNNSKYLEPKIESQQHSYVELTETTSSKMQMQPDKERSEDTFQMGNEGSRSSSQYDDTVNNSVMASADENLKETVKQNNDTYLDVVNAGDNTYLDVSVS